MAPVQAPHAHSTCVLTRSSGLEERARAAGPGLRLLYVGFAAIVLLYFVRFVGPGIYGGFNNDDPMNIHSFWIRGPGRLTENLVLFFTTYGRPMGGVYFSVLYRFFGLDPFPYRALHK